MTHKIKLSIIASIFLFAILIGFTSASTAPCLPGDTCSSSDSVNFTNIGGDQSNGQLFVNFISPTQGTDYSSQNVLINISSNATSLGGSVWFVLDGGSEQQYMGAYSLIQLSNGSHTITAYANDSQGNTVNQTITFTINQGGNDDDNDDDDDGGDDDNCDGDSDNKYDDSDEPTNLIPQSNSDIKYSNGIIQLNTFKEGDKNPWYAWMLSLGGLALLLLVLILILIISIIIVASRDQSLNI